MEYRQKVWMGPSWSLKQHTKVDILSLELFAEVSEEALGAHNVIEWKSPGCPRHHLEEICLSRMLMLSLDLA